MQVVLIFYKRGKYFMRYAATGYKQRCSESIKTRCVIQGWELLRNIIL